MNNPRPILVKLKSVALVGGIAFLATAASHASFVGPATPGVEGSVTLSPAVPVAEGLPTGTLLASLVAPFSETFGANFSGTLTSKVYDRDPGPGILLDFYYLVSNTSPGKPSLPAGISDIYRFDTDKGTYAGVTGVLFNGVTDTINGVASGTGSFAKKADFGFGQPNAIGFEWNVLDGIAGNLDVGQKSQWLVVRTNASIYANALGGVFGVGSAFAQTFAPVPEPATIGFGVAMLGVCASSFLQRRRKVA